jgi:hypothetical protein
VGADYVVTSCDLGVFLDESTESITPQYPNDARRIRSEAARRMVGVEVVFIMWSS